MKNMKSENKNYLIKWESNWADEMDVSGFVVATEKELDEWKTILKNRKTGFMFYIGTNEELYYDSGKQLLSECKIKEITKEEAVVLKKLFKEQFGFMEFWYYVLEWMEEDSEDGVED
jgi:hypothetical protein